MKIKTVNVIELKSGILESIQSFDETPEGNKEAEECFSKLILAKDIMEQEFMEEHLDNGYWENMGGYEVMISHSV